MIVSHELVSSYESNFRIFSIHHMNQFFSFSHELYPPYKDKHIRVFDEKNYFLVGSHRFTRNFWFLFDYRPIYIIIFYIIFFIKHYDFNYCFTYVCLHMVSIIHVKKKNLILMVNWKYTKIWFILWNQFMWTYHHMNKNICETIY